ncbi:MAG: hypothetical protein ACRDRH_09860 [Pseudonocardia sp.]
MSNYDTDFGSGAQNANNSGQQYVDQSDTEVSFTDNSYRDDNSYTDNSVDSHDDVHIEDSFNTVQNNDQDVVDLKDLVDIDVL